MTLSILLNLSLPMIHALLKNRAQKRKMRNLNLQIFKAIKTAYNDGEDFQ